MLPGRSVNDMSVSLSENATVYLPLTATAHRPVCPLD